MEKLRILIVEDAKLIRDRIASALSKFSENIEIHLATKMSEAFIGLIDHHPNVIILDISLPDGNGLRILEKVKIESPNTIVIVLTNFPFPQVKKKCKQLGADYFFSKENEFDNVIKTVEALLLNKKKEAEYHFEE